MGKGKYRIAIILALIAALGGGWWLAKSRVAASSTQKNAITRARLSESATVHSARRGFPFLNLTDGHALLTVFEGETEAVSLMASQASALRPLALASADLDEDGVPDLICTYDSPRGPLVAVYRGNIDARHPHSAEANQRRAQGTFTDAPFLAPARVFAAPTAGEFAVAGDINGDGHLDLVITTHASRSLYVMTGDGQGGFGATRVMGLPGAVTAMASGDVNRADGVADLIVGVTQDDGPRALIFEGKRGALDAIPESFALPAAATGFAVDRFDNDAYADVAMACGRSLILLCGRDRGPAMDTTTAKQALIGRRDFAFNISSITAGHFGEGRSAAVGLLADDGAVYALHAKTQKAKGKTKPRAPQWTVEKMSAAQPGATRLQMAHLSSLRGDELLALDTTGRQLRVIETTAAKSSAAEGVHSMAVDFDVEGEAVAALTMRLNTDALDDLVILRRGDSAPTILTSTPALIFTVTNTGDNGGVDPAPGAGTGTLRQAFVDANASPGTDTIQFSIGSGPQTISPSAGLPSLTEAVTLDATTQPGFSGTPLIEITGATAGDVSCLNVQTNNSAVSGLVINRYPGNGINLGISTGNNVITGNFIGTNASGTIAAPNSRAVELNGTSGNQVGGTTAGAGNLLSGNTGSGVAIENGATGNMVQGNLIGTNAAGTAALGNGDSGIGIMDSTGNTIGGAAAGAGNLISGNAGSGIFLSGTLTGTLIQGNRIGTNASGTAGLANDDGVAASSGATGASIGGAGAGAGNTIAFNMTRGVSLNALAGAGNTISGNAIFSNGILGIDLNDDGVTANDSCDGDTGPNNLQNFPVLTAATSNGVQTTVQGSLNSAGGANFRVEFFSSPACDASGNGQGSTFLGSTNVMTDAACMASFTAVLPVSVAGGNVITATATSSTGDTSEFSACVNVTASSADLSIVVDGSPDPVPAGTDLTFSITVANAGPDSSINVTLSDLVPANTTFKSLMAPAGWSCTTPPMGGTGLVTCTTSAMLSGQMAMFTLVVTVNPATPGGTAISFSANLESDTSDPDLSNNNGTDSVVVTSAACAFTCPQNITANSSATQCGSAVDYTVPSSVGCTVTCAPPPGTVFAIGTTTVTCTGSGGPSCSFTIRVVDNTPPAITCPFPFSVSTDKDKNTAVVNYIPATATDACGLADVTCLPPSGSTFALGTATITCTARDVNGNTSTCSFTVTVNDADAPVITCPQNITMALPATQTSAVINYPPATATDNQPGVVVTCAPPSGSTFPLGVSTVTCVATDVSGNRATCGFSVSLTGGPANIEVIIPTGHPALEFGTDQPVPVPRKNKNRATGPCAAFTVVNRSFSALTLTLDSIVRAGADTTNGRITDPREGDVYSLSIVTASGADTPLDINDTVTIPVGGRVSFCLRFTPTIPAVAGSTTQLRAPQAIPDQIASRVVFRVTGGSPLTVNVNALVETGVHLINPNNPKKPATLNFTKSGDEFSVTFAAYDANNNVSSARYEFLDVGGTVVAGPFDVDLTAAIRDRNLTRGQSFTVTQRFTGADSNRNVVSVRVTVTDGETSVTSPNAPLDAASSAAVRTASRLRYLQILPPPVQMNPSRP